MPVDITFLVTRHQKINFKMRRHVIDKNEEFIISEVNQKKTPKITLYFLKLPKANRYESECLTY